MALVTTVTTATATATAADLSAVAESFGLLVGWMFVTYGLVLWGSGRLVHHPVAYPFVFVTAGFAIMLTAVDALLPGSVFTGEYLGVVGYAMFAALGTTIFTILIIYSLEIEAADLGDDHDPNCD